MSGYKPRQSGKLSVRPPIVNASEWSELWEPRMHDGGMMCSHAASDGLEVIDGYVQISQRAFIYDVYDQLARVLSQIEC